MVRLSSIRSAISNFVRILTRQSVPVYFNSGDANVNFGGKIIYISAKITSKQDFDVAVGQALHEGAHTLKTDFDVVKSAWANIPHNIFKLSDSKNISRLSLERFIHTTWNVVEDRYIDDYVFNSAPGYRGYYVALYDRFWNCPEIDKYLKSDEFRYPSLKSYSFRITNFTNDNTDLLALPHLDDIAQVIDITNINRLETTMDRVKTAFKVTEIVLDCIDKQDKIESEGGNTPSLKKSNGLANPSDYFDFGDSDDKSDSSDGNSDNSDDTDDSDVSKKIIQEISDVMSGKDTDPSKSKENENASNRISDEPLDKKVEKEIDKLIQNQQKFLAGDLPKEGVTDNQKAMLDLIEKHGISLVRVELPISLKAGNSTCLKIDCIVVRKLTRELILSGQDLFPLAGNMKVGGITPEPDKNVADAVRKGISLGTKLGKKLQIRAEKHPIKIIRKKSGKINKRQLHEAAFDAEALFKNIIIEKRPNANIHITVDASGSMSGNKWNKTMTAIVAICKATSMVNNIHTTVSFRTTQVSGQTQLPYIILAYDSNIDKFNKIRTLFPYLIPNGGTPEGLAFSAIMSLFEGITPDEEDRYFLNLSDGEPYFVLVSSETGIVVDYSDETGISHTKSQVDKIRRRGIEILSYFIEDDYNNQKSTKKVIKIKDDSPSRNAFRKMYGKNSKFIDVNSVVDLAKTINGLFLKTDA